MDWLYSLFVEHSALQAVVVLSLISAIGLGLGKIHICGISLGVTFVFFAGIIAGHFGLSIDPQMLNYAESFGLVIFVYALGLQVGPGFFSSFRTGGVQLNMLAVGGVLIGTVMTLLGSYGLGISLPDMVGILCGATTNTPALGAAQQTLKQMGIEANTPALGCAVAYPLGVVGVILGILMIRKALVRKEDLEIKEKDDANKPYIVAFQVHNPAIFNMSVKDIAQLSYPKFVISRLWRDGNVSIPTSEKVIKEGDRLLMRDHPECVHGMVVAMDDTSSQEMKWATGKGATEHIYQWAKKSFNEFTSGEQADWEEIRASDISFGYCRSRIMALYGSRHSDTTFPVYDAIADYAATHPAPTGSSGWVLPGSHELATLCFGAPTSFT